MRILRSPRFWSPLPFVASLVAFVMAGHLALEGDRRERTEALGLLGSGLICFSIGCICRTSLGVALSQSPPITPTALGERQ